MINLTIPTRIKNLYFNIFRPILPRETVNEKVAKLKVNLEYILFLSLESNISFNNGIYLVDISQITLQGAEPRYGEIFNLRFYIYRDYVRIHLLIIPYYLRHKGFGRYVWQIFINNWKEQYKYYEAEYKTKEAYLFWKKMGFAVDYSLNINLDPSGKYSGRKMYYQISNKNILH